jgi:hypothetical protein
MERRARFQSAVVAVIGPADKLTKTVAAKKIVAKNADKAGTIFAL